MRCWLSGPLILVALGGCGSGQAPIGEKAPEFGGAGKYATTAGFLEGRWKQGIDRTSATSAVSDITPEHPDTILEFFPNHTCTLHMDEDVVALAWKEEGDGIHLHVVGVNGKSVDAAYEKLQSRVYTPETGRLIGLLNFANGIKNVRLMPDKKRLLQVSSQHPDGSNIFGKTTWNRVGP